MPSGVVVDLQNKPIGKLIAGGVAVNNDGKVIGSISKTGLMVLNEGFLGGLARLDGRVWDKSEKSVAKIINSGDALAENGSVLGHIIEVGGAVVDLNGVFLGRLFPNGIVKNTKGEELGTIGVNGYVFDASRNIIGGLVKQGAAIDNFVITSYSIHYTKLYEFYLLQILRILVRMATQHLQNMRLRQHQKAVQNL